jgi:1-acyl-sn-glycerol-3-phosphate acyltransferase
MVQDLSTEQSVTRARVRVDDSGPDSTLLRRLWYDSCKTLVQFTLISAFRIRYSGVENIPLRGAALVVCNHQSHLDPPLVGAGSPRRLSYLARESLFRFRLLAWLMRSLNGIPIDREGSGMAGMKETLRRLKRGEAVVIFPEGTRSPDGQIGPFRQGFAALALRSKAAIVPATLEGAFDAWPRYRDYPLPRTIHVHYGRPIPPDELSGRSEAEMVAEVQARVQAGLELIRSRSVFVRRGERQP